jgi:hypothetical protein
MKQATHFIEQIRFDSGIKNLTIQPIKLLPEAKRIGEKFNVNTIAFFKVYPKVKPAIAHYDNEVKAVIIE